MRLDVRGINVQNSPAIDAHVRRRFGFALDHLAHRVRSAVVRLSDENGPRGGEAKNCHITVQLHPRGTVVVNERSADLYHAVDRATTRLKKAVLRTSERHSARHRR
jgi:ribosomal subunit interface protein